MFAITAEIFVNALYEPEGHSNIVESTLTSRDKYIYGIPEKIAYLDLITGIALIVIGCLVAHNIIAINGANYFIGFGSANLAVGFIFKLLSCCCPCLGLGPKRWHGEIHTAAAGSRIDNSSHSM